MQTDVLLRPLTPADGPAVAQLCKHSPDTGRVPFYFRYAVDAYQALVALKPASIAVVAEHPSTQALILDPQVFSS